MSRSKNVRSRYADVPRYIKVSISVRDSGGVGRSRDDRPATKRMVSAEIRGILKDTFDEKEGDVS